MKDKEHRKESLSNLRSMKPDELDARKSEWTEKLFWLRFKQQGGQLDKPSEIRKTRKAIARANTIVREKAAAKDKGAS